MIKPLSVLLAAGLLLAACGSGDGVPVTYDVFGTGSTTVTYYDGSKDVTETVKLPWHKELTIDKAKVTLKVQAGEPGQETGVTACAISANNQQVATGTPMNPAFKFVLCSYEYTAG